MINEEHSIIWRRIDMPGHESVRIYNDSDGRYLDGAAIFFYKGQPCRLEYLIECDLDWQTTFVSVDGWVGNELIEFEIEVDGGTTWFLNGEEVPAVEGCVDIDLNFRPVTNVLPIQRLKPAVGESKSVRSAWLRFPTFALEPLEQIYTRVDDSTVRYESGGGQFTRELKVNESGLVTEYPDFWTLEGWR